MKTRLLAYAGIATALFFAVGLWVYVLLPRPVEASRNSSGSYTLYSPGNPAVTNQLISTSLWNNTFGDIATELSDSLSRSGKGGMTAALRGSDGTVTAPAFAFTSETGTGLYRIGSSDLGVSINQVKKLELTSSLFTVTPALTVTGAATLSSTLALSDVFTQSVSGTASTFLANFFEASLANGNSGTIAVGKANSANASVGLQFNPNATAANSTGCLVVNGQTGTLCVDGNNKTIIGAAATVATTLGVTGATTAIGGITIGASGTAIAQLNYGSCTLDGASPSKCTATVVSGAKCTANYVSTSNVQAADVSVTTTTLTVTVSNGQTGTVNYICVG